MPLRSSLARSLQYAMANMADIKTPLCALQPTPAIPHTASRSGAGTRARGGGARARAGAGTERASRQPPAPAGRAVRAWLLEAPALRGPGGGRGGVGARTPGADSPRLLSLPARAHFLTLARSRRRLLTGEGARKLCAPHAGFPNGRGGRIGWAALLPGTGELRHLSPPLAAGIGAGAMPEATAAGGGVRSGAPGALRTDGSRWVIHSYRCVLGP